MKKSIILLGILFLLSSSFGMGVQNLDDDELTEEYRNALFAADSNIDGSIAPTELTNFTAEVNRGVVDFVQNDADAVEEFANRDLNYYLVFSISEFDQASEDIKSFSNNNKDLLRNYDDGDGRISIEDIHSAIIDNQEDTLTDEKLRKLWAARAATERRDYNYQEYISDDPEEANIGHSVEIMEGEKIVFGSGNANSLEVDSIREDTSNDDASFFEFKTGQGLDQRIVYVESSGAGRVEKVNFETGEFTVFVEELSVEENEAVIRIERDFSQSSNFECAPRNLKENQYAFCTDNGEESVKQIDLGHTARTLDYKYNDRAYGAGEGVAMVFTDSAGMTLTVTQRGLNYKQAGIEIVEWRGLRHEHGGTNQQAIIEVDPVKTPEASIDTDKNSVKTGEMFNVNFEAFSQGLYILEARGAGVSREIEFKELENSESLEFTPGKSGEVRLNLLAPGNWWNPLNSDRVIDEEVITVEKREDSPRDEYSFGERFRLSEGDSATVEGRNFYLRAIGPDMILWRPDRSSDTNSGINLLDDPTRMDFRYSDGFNGYGYLCNVSGDYASIVVESREMNPWDVCDRNPSELRGNSGEYKFEEYELGKKTTVSPGEGLAFGESRVYVEDISKLGGIWKVDGYKDWKGEISDYSAGPINYSSTDYFFEGEIASGLCDVSQGEAKIVLEREDEISSKSNWPQSYCIEDDRPDDSGDLEITKEPSTPSWGNSLEVSEGTTISPVYWGEGFTVESLRDGILNIVSVNGERELSIGEGEMSTFYQDYVIHSCSIDGREGTVSITRGTDSQREVCGREEPENPSTETEADIRTEGKILEITGSMEVPDPCYETEASEFDVRAGEVEVFIEPVRDDPGAACASVISEASIDVSRELDPGRYSVKVVITERDGDRKQLSKDINISGEGPDLEVEVRPEQPGLTDEVVLSARPEGYTYEWDTDTDGEFESEGSSITLSYERAGSKEVTVRTQDSLVRSEKTVSFDVSNPDIDSSLTVSKDEISLEESVTINYSVGEAVSRNGYRLEIDNPTGETVMTKSESSMGGTERFIPGKDAEIGDYHARLVANEGFLSSIFRSIFGPEAEDSFKVVDDSETLSEWRNYCEENGYDHKTASGRVSCIQNDIGPECFNSNPGTECREIAESVCEYYRGTGFDAENGKCK